MLKVGKNYDTLRVVNDQIGTLTYTYDLASLLLDVAETEEYGVSKVTRPFNWRLDKSKLVENGFIPLPTWQDALQRYLTALEEGRMN